MAALLRYDAACQAIAAAKTVDEVSEWLDKAAAVREYGRRIKNRQLEIDAIEIRVRAKKRRGELVLQLKSEGRVRDGKKRSSDDDRLTLEDLGLTKNESSEEQAIARIEGNAFERLVARCRNYTEQNPEKHSFNVLKPPPEGGPINGARTVMGSRVEPADSLDYFPTPPWATRALMQHVMPEVGFGGRRLKSVWEPACGEGHIAEVLAEYADVMIATDIHDYGYGQVADFLASDLHLGLTADWIVTNPPFKDRTEAFVLRAIDRAKVGVAMFVRMQWLETTGRYERIFSKTPPTVIAFFSERVPLCKGEWKPEGDTATAYIWLVWVKGRAPQAPFWIPPGCRTDLDHDADATRFTTRPVMTERRIVEFCDGHLVDVASGEIIEIEAERGATASEGQAPDDDCGTQSTTGDVTRVTAGDVPESPVAASPEAAASHAECVGPAASTSSVVEEPPANESRSTGNVAQPHSKSESDDNLEIPAILRRYDDKHPAPVTVASPCLAQSVTGEGAS